MLCRDIMQHPVRWISESDSVEVAARIMRDESIGFLPVCDRSGRFTGTLTDRDIAIRVVAEGKCSGAEVGSIMTRETVMCSADDDVERAAEVMERQRKQRIVCADPGGHVLGILSISDLARHSTPELVVGDALRQVTARDARDAAH